jgi:hypothetical protein
MWTDFVYKMYMGVSTQAFKVIFAVLYKESTS